MYSCHHEFGSESLSKIPSHQLQLRNDKLTIKFSSLTSLEKSSIHQSRTMQDPVTTSNFDKDHQANWDFTCLTFFAAHILCASRTVTQQDPRLKQLPQFDRSVFQSGFPRLSSNHQKIGIKTTFTHFQLQMKWYFLMHSSTLENCQSVGIDKKHL